MQLGFDRPLFILPFDQRSSFEKGLFGFKPPLTEDQTATVIASKQVVYEGFKLALGKGAPRDAAGILVDEQFGAAILRDARAEGFITCAPTEKSGQEEFAFEYGDRWRDHVEAFAPTFAKVLVRYNAENDEAMNRRQAARLKELSDYCRQTGRRFLFELLVPMNLEQSDRLEGSQRLYDQHLRPSLMISAIKELQQAGVEPDVWKVEGLDRRADCEALVSVARRDGRSGVGCIVLGRGADEAGVLSWLRTAATVPGFIGFAVGRTSFWDPLAGLRDHKLSRDAAAARIADHYAEWIGAFTAARAG
ncbi:2-deoxy-5-keto-D-gluconate 6-phosphate aldolase domain-containing protein [Bradyrhizobium sp.]|jgi:myo-inositol catabolism protein IolC|uniref:2-deoxy-5-keto-D-gluconate 6-phosphate aldolase domain-containing protein n=1 Tax=Bradyrhizobium sp. TaxID=376 RepID=UPI003C265E7C